MMVPLVQERAQRRYQRRRGRFRYHALERGVGSARRIDGGTRGFGKTLPNLLATRKKPAITYKWSSVPAQKSVSETVDLCATGPTPSAGADPRG